MSLNQAVSQVMQIDIHTVDVSAPISEVRSLMRTHGLHHLPVLENDELVGVVSFSDLLGLGFGRDVGASTPFVEAIDQWHPLREVMEPAMVTIGAKATLAEAAERLSTGSYHSLPVVNGRGQLVGILTSTDLVKTLHRLLTKAS